MKFKYVPNLDQILNRFEAFWKCEIIDRPMYSIVIPKEQENQVKIEWPDYQGNWEKRWLDIDFRVQEDEVRIQNHYYFGDAIPFVCPGMGTDILAASNNCSYRFDGITGWSLHDLSDWSLESKFHFDKSNKYYKAQMEYVRKSIDNGKGKYVIGHPDYHPTGDQLASMRGTENALMDLILYPDNVKTFLKRTQQDFYNIYDEVENLLKEAGMPSMSWTNIAAKRRHWMICNDFSIMISPDMFDEFFIPYIEEESTKFENSMYHLDGAGAVHHLDSLLKIPTLKGIQFLPGAGAGKITDYIVVFKKIQDSGKCLEILQPHVNELSIIFKNLRPEGVILNWIVGVNDSEHAKEIEQQIVNWGRAYGY